jgi:NAD(P)-dependent dehydrogenase (short-subunit alcohol dehydrogenase family)
MLSDQVVLITGCSTGIGRALVEEFALGGHRVIATARRPDAIADLKRDQVDAMRLDVTDPVSIQEAVGVVVEREGRIDILINNAGYGQMGPVLDLSLEQVRRQLETNVVGAIAMVQAVAPHMIAKRHGRIVNIGSISGILTTPFAGIYCASKAALHSVSEATRMELAPFGIDVIVVQPGGVRSRFGDNASLHVATREASPYRAIEGHINRRAQASQVNATPAEQVARRIVEATVQDKAPFVVRVGHGGRTYPMLKRLAPARWLDTMLVRRFGLDRL